MCAMLMSARASGCIALSLLDEFKHLRGTAVELSEAAAALALENAHRYASHYVFARVWERFDAYETGSTCACASMCLFGFTVLMVCVHQTEGGRAVHCGESGRGKVARARAHVR